MDLQTRKKAIEWWSKLSFEDKFYKTIAANSVLIGDTVDNHPDRLTGESIEKVFMYHSKIKSCPACGSKRYIKEDNYFECTDCASTFI